MAVYEFECKACGKHFEVSVPVVFADHGREASYLPAFVRPLT